MNTITNQELVETEFNLDLYIDIFSEIEQMIEDIYSPLVEINRYYTTIHMKDLKAQIQLINDFHSPEERYEFWGVEEITLDNFNETDAYYDIKDECYEFNPIEIYNIDGELTELIYMVDGLGDVSDLDVSDLDRYTFLTADEIIIKLVDLFKKYEGEDYEYYEDKINNHIQRIKEIKEEYADYYN